MKLKKKWSNCKICGTEYTQDSYKCLVCGSRNPNYWKGARDKLKNTRLDIAKSMHEPWMELVSKQNKAPFLTESEWLEACRYFRGCAICRSEHIEIREFFVNFKQGGKYTAWNIIPICTSCKKKFKLKSLYGYFSELLLNTSSKELLNRKVKLNKIMKYLKRYMEEEQ